MLHIDIETYSSVDLRSSGLYKYAESLDFEVLMIAYAIDSAPVKVIDLAQGEELDEDFLLAFTDSRVTKAAHNATFERICLAKIGLEAPIDQWSCSAIKAAYCGLPLGLDKAGQALGLTDKAKDRSGKALIRYFSMPCKPTNSNGKRSRNQPMHDPGKWQEFKDYCAQDVEAERAIHSLLSKYELPALEKAGYALDQKINDYGILVDTELAKSAFDLDNTNRNLVVEQTRQLTGLDNPNSVAQLKTWLEVQTGKEVESLAKDKLKTLLSEYTEGCVAKVLNNRAELSKSSVKKYKAMLDCVSDEDNRARGLFQFYGANRTGRWAGRLVQLQNLPRNYIDDLDKARNLVKQGNYELVSNAYDNIPDVLSQLIRTAFIAEQGYTFAVSDFSAIEARVIAWLAGEDWRMEVFRSHGKIYEASASKMFGVPIEEITKGSELRTRGKIAELALGYQGGVGALKAMGADKMGLKEHEMKSIVNRWRQNNPEIVKLWNKVDEAAKAALTYKKSVRYRGLTFESDSHGLRARLPSGRELFYHKARMGVNSWGHPSIKYKGQGLTGPNWVDVDTYGGKLTENIVQAIARDLLLESMIKLEEHNYRIIMHVHDEVVCKVPEESATSALKDIERIMALPPDWAKDMPLTADGYITPYYKKD